MRLGTAVGAALALAMAGCSADYVEGDRSTVLLTIQSINGGAPVLSDVRGSGEDPDTIVNCETQVEVTVRTKNPNVTATAVQDVTPHPLRGVATAAPTVAGCEGVDVPYTISGNMTVLAPAGGELIFPVDLVRHAGEDRASAQQHQRGCRSSR